MVFFTCNHCGESVKKPAVDKHYSGKCRGARKNVSCMDCLKDFLDEEYVAHTSCITEAEKYSGKDYVAKTPKNSGQKKQENWMGIIRSILNSKEYQLSKETRGAFQKLQTVNNVPRKKAKFENFIGNMRLRRDQAEQVWDILEKELNKIKANQQSTNSGPAENPTNGTTASEVAGELDIKKESTSEIPLNGTKRPKKRKGGKVSQKESDLPNSGFPEAQSEKITDITPQHDQGEPEKKKKKKKNNEGLSLDKIEESIAGQVSTISTTTPTKFAYVTTIEQALQKHGGSMKLAKLKKKVRSKYLASQELSEMPEGQENKFDKKFTKSIKKSGLKVENDIVSIIECIANAE